MFSNNKSPRIFPIILWGIVFLGYGLTWFTFDVIPAEAAKKDLKQALKSGQKTIQFSGKENDDITIRRGVAVIGSSPTSAVIDGDIRMEDGTSLSNTTVNGQSVSITIAKGANVTLTNVTVRGGTEAGIATLEGGGTLTVKNSRITKNRKGFYILPGKNLFLSGNQITDNKEEGIDARSGVTGTITGNQINQNGEGGAEIIVGASRLTVSGNTFSGNKASGLAFQIYPSTGSGQRVSVIDNTFTDNGHYGIDCQAPSGANKRSALFETSLTSQDSSFRNNRSGSINDWCHIRNTISPPTEVAGETIEETIPEEAQTATGPFLCATTRNESFEKVAFMMADDFFLNPTSLSASR